MRYTNMPTNPERIFFIQDRLGHKNSKIHISLVDDYQLREIRPGVRPYFYYWPMLCRTDFDIMIEDWVMWIQIPNERGATVDLDSLKERGTFRPKTLGIVLDGYPDLRNVCKKCLDNRDKLFYGSEPKKNGKVTPFDKVREFLQV